MTVFLETEDKYTLAEFPVENSELEELIQQFDGQTKVQVTIPEMLTCRTMSMTENLQLTSGV